MIEPTIRVPVVCPKCGREKLTEFPVDEVAYALCLSSPSRLGLCHLRPYFAGRSIRLDNIQGHLTSTAQCAWMGKIGDSKEEPGEGRVELFTQNNCLLCRFMGPHAVGRAPRRQRRAFEVSHRGRRFFVGRARPSFGPRPDCCCRMALAWGVRSSFGRHAHSSDLVRRFRPTLHRSRPLRRL